MLRHCRKQCAKCIKIGTGVTLPVILLRRCITAGSITDFHTRFFCSGCTEIHKVYFTTLCYHHVVRLQIPVENRRVLCMEITENPAQGNFRFQNFPAGKPLRIRCPIDFPFTASITRKLFVPLSRSSTAQGIPGYENFCKRNASRRSFSLSHILTLTAYRFPDPVFSAR